MKVRHHNATSSSRHHRRSRLEVSTVTGAALSIRTAAHSQGITQVEISKKTGRSLRTVRRWFAGESPVDLGALGNMPELLRHFALCFHRWTREWVKKVRRNG